MNREIKSSKKHEQKIKILASTCGQCHITNGYVLFAPVKTLEGITAVRKEKNESFFCSQEILWKKPCSCGTALIYVQQQTTQGQVHSTTNLRTFQKYSHVYSKLTSKGQMLNDMAKYQREGGRNLINRQG